MALYIQQAINIIQKTVMRFMRRIPVMLAVPLALLCIFAESVSAETVPPVRVGVLAFRPKPITQAQWQPLAGVLKRGMPERDFEIVALTLPEMEKAVASRELDFVLTNSGHYILLSKRFGLSSPIATLVVKENGHPTRSFGGVIFARAENAEIGSLISLKNKKIATVGTDSLGAYQMQAYELRHLGIRLPQDAQMIVTGLPQDKVIEAVLSGRADVGFVRTGVLEALEREGKLDGARVRVINSQYQSRFPVAVSTRLYPEWPFAALPDTDERLAQHVAAALFMLETNSAAAQAMKVHSFVIPGDYSTVSDVLRELRAPPFEDTPLFGMRDVMSQYRWQLLLVLFAGGLVVFMNLRLVWTKRKLNEEHHLVLHQQQQMQQMAYYDMLTMLPNRRLLYDRLGQTIAACKRNNRYAALMFLDLDNFKPLNDVHGHEVGDLLLIEVARRLKSCVREIDTVARLGGDEFVILLSELLLNKEESAAQASIVAEKIRAAIFSPYRLTIERKDQADTIVEHHCSASIGVTLFRGQEKRPEEILNHADVAMYRAKELGRNRIYFLP